jgi:hypothetical protein
MSGLLFLGTVVGFVLIAYWAYRNDTAGLGEHGTGFLAMRPTSGAKPKVGPKWKKEVHLSPEVSRHLASPKPDGDKKPRWNQTFLPGRNR